MKQYVTVYHLRVIGKGWEVRRELNRLAASAVGEGLLSDYTRSLPPIRATLGSSNPALSDSDLVWLTIGEPCEGKPF
ncbi:hypothetical protein [Paenibacillus sp. PAMC21692]|jgi:hypothetical protein|uniref:hypothetical protein n=1 Tax=Paenibacillus sp. PAMC21692 TaxID=2762320 RepID=UPI00164D7A46|nr:hypothetical protein [Paenibacillus sp. PAMC21692]QNK55430.1 hypothetical protein H7F31_22840 [Paenibacillus sp. PAMC21692]